MAYGLMSNLMRGIRPRVMGEPERPRPGSRLPDPVVKPAAGRGVLTRVAAALRKRRKKEM